MAHVYGSPFNTGYSSPKAPLPRNYSDEFNPEEYECKSSIELESYQRNLLNYLKGLLSQDPFPAALFEKLEKRVDGITSILKKRYQEKKTMNLEQAKRRLEQLSAELAPSTSTAGSESTEDTTEDTRPMKKRKIEPVYVQQVRQAMQETKNKDKFTFNEEAEEEEED